MNFHQSKPIYHQVADYICEQILNGQWTEGRRIPSVREIGITLEVNPNTAVRSFEYLQQKKIIHEQRGIGNFVSPSSKEKIKEHYRRQFILEELPLIIKTMKLTGITIQEIEEEYNKQTNK
jgi:DNA-binding transcriptional regulator YhcF (GntR family)